MAMTANNNTYLAKFLDHVSKGQGIPSLGRATALPLLPPQYNASALLLHTASIFSLQNTATLLLSIHRCTAALLTIMEVGPSGAMLANTSWHIHISSCVPAVVAANPWCTENSCCCSSNALMT